VLHPELGAALGAERFLSEIRTTARLQHPHILPLLDSGDANGLLYYVMPLVTGENLRARLDREKQLPIDDTVLIAREVADALNYAHSLGVIHRDIKPENILLQGGHALVADFGIALAVQHAAGARMTQTGLSLGTPQYMSPEQAMGERTIDARSDIYALGAVTYEMLTGEPPFTGNSVQAIVAKVLTERPTAIHTLRDTVPRGLEEAINTSLAKLPADRFATAAVFAAALANARQPGVILANSGANSAARSATRSSSSNVRWLVPLLIVALVISTAFAVRTFNRASSEQSVTRAFLSFPEAEKPILQRSGYTILPDGSAIIYIGVNGSGTQLWMRKRSELHAIPIGGTAGVIQFFVSPDGKWIGFIAKEKVMKVPVGGGEPITIGDSPCQEHACETFNGGAFLDNGFITFSARAALILVSADGSKRDTLVPSSTISGLAATQPHALPGSHAVLFATCTLYCRQSDVWVVEVGTKKAKRIIPNASHPIYLSSGQIVYVDRQGVANAVAFDATNFSVSGEAVPLFNRVVGPIVVSQNGTLLYGDADPETHSDLVVVKRDGTARNIDSNWRGDFASLSVSFDGKRVAATVIDKAEEHIWIKSLDGGPPARLTLGQAQYSTPSWSGDGSSVFYTRFVPDSSSFRTRPADGSGGEKLLRSGDDWVIESEASRDGEWLVQREYHKKDGSRAIFARRLSGDTTTRTIVNTKFSSYSPSLSPDAKWMAYVTEESGQSEVWVVPFPDPGTARWQISAEGGSEPAWSRDGKEIFYVDRHQQLIAVSVTTQGVVAVGKSQLLFSTAPYRRHPTHRAYGLLPGNQGFVMIRDGSATTKDLVLVDNWFTELQQKMKASKATQSSK
ncbi:MAG: protein kinase, partial [Gemmatimonadaceae bacterium]